MPLVALQVNILVSFATTVTFSLLALESPEMRARSVSRTRPQTLHFHAILRNCAHFSRR